LRCWCNQIHQFLPFGTVASKRRQAAYFYVPAIVLKLFLLVLFLLVITTPMPQMLAEPQKAVPRMIADLMG
jgi:hypothetical protein